MKPSATATEPRVLVVKLSSLGDLFHALPAVRQLKRALGARVDWVTQPEYADLVRCFSDVDRVITFPRRGFPLAAPAFLRALRQERYDLVADLQGLLKSALTARLARGARRIGPSFSREGARWLYSAVAGPTNKDRHAVDEALDVVRFLKVELLPPVFPLAFPRQPLDVLRPRVALVPCSRWPTKNWPPERFAAVGRALRERSRAALFLIGGGADRAVCATIAGLLGTGVVNTAGQSSLVQTGSLLQEMDLVLTVDSGPLHMAAALGVPVLAVFGATDPKRTGPYGPGHRVLAAEGLDCRPCRARACARKDLACLQAITAEQVFAEALAMLDGGASKQAGAP